MSDYIKRSDACRAILALEDRDIPEDRYPDTEFAFNEGLVRAANKVADLPAADVVERKSGEWVGYPDSFKYDHVYDRDAIVCPFCEESWNIVYNDTGRFNFCPNCGADMREGGRKNDNC